VGSPGTIKIGPVEPRELNAQGSHDGLTGYECWRAEASQHKKNEIVQPENRTDPIEVSSGLPSRRRLLLHLVSEIVQFSFDLFRSFEIHELLLEPRPFSRRNVSPVAGCGRLMTSAADRSIPSWGPVSPRRSALLTSSACRSTKSSCRTKSIWKCCNFGGVT
jgi:hypothetical protein